MKEKNEVKKVFKSFEGKDKLTLIFALLALGVLLVSFSSIFSSGKSVYGNSLKSRSEEDLKKILVCALGNEEVEVVVSTGKNEQGDEMVCSAVIVAKGADSAQMQAYITEAVKNALNIGVHKITVLPKNTLKEE